MYGDAINPLELSHLQENSIIDLGKIETNRHISDRDLVFSLSFQHPCEQRQIIPKMPGQEEILPNEFSCGISHPFHGIPMVQEITHPMGGSFRSVDEVARLVVRDLQVDATHIAPDDGFSFPKTFRDREPEALASRLLNNDIGQPLKGVDRPVCIRGQEKDMNVRVVTGRLSHFIEYLRPLRIIRGIAAGQDELNRQNLANEVVSLDDTDWILEAVEARYLDQQGAIRIQPELAPDLFQFTLVETNIFFAQGINAWRDDELGIRQELSELAH